MIWPRGNRRLITVSRGGKQVVRVSLERWDLGGIDDAAGTATLRAGAGVSLPKLVNDLAALGWAVGDRLQVQAGSAELPAVPFGTTFASVPPGELVVLQDSRGRIALCINLGSAAGFLGIGYGSAVEFRRGVRA